MKKRIVSVFAIGLMAAGCSTELKRKAEMADTKNAIALVQESSPVSEGRSMDRLEKEVVGSGEPRDALESAREFDWGPRYLKLVEYCAAHFTEPEIGREMTLVFENGKSVTGSLTKLTDSWVHLTVESGGTVKLATDQLSTASRCQLFKDDYVNFFANKRLMEEQSTFQATGKLPR